ncbi:hypothetical protein [Jannaschia sp. CCS1]|uniref:hypothetical protein n=1 Tax=Jannaschia sp. (strain CCS1) TaxID=290400 RepID=UPI000053B03C|nr:hypothetical protein [Jannaschia sp. CCS1]ABD54072.1 hypothetical protein Jann_1155 [Jannaschia sp. CCS1]
MRHLLSGALVSLALTGTAQGQSPWDVIALTDSYCTGSGGNFTGMGCEDGSSGGLSPREQALAALEQEWLLSVALAQEQADSFQAGYYAWLEGYTPEDMSAIPHVRRPDLPNADHPDMIDAYLCLRSNIASLALAADAPALFEDAAGLYRSTLAGYAGAHARMAYYHLSQILVTAYPEAGPLSLETPDHAAFVRGILAAEIGSVGFFASGRAAGFAATWEVGDAHFDALLYHIGFHPGTYEHYDSLLAGLSCRTPDFRAGIPESARTVAFVRTLEMRPDWTDFTLRDLLPPDDMAAFGFADEADQMVAFLRAAQDRPMVRLSQVDFPSPVIAAYVDSLGTTAALFEVIELRPGDPRPRYADLHAAGFPVGRTLFVPSLEVFVALSDREIMGLIEAGQIMRGRSIPGYVALYEETPAEIATMLEQAGDRLCMRETCR